MKDPIWPATGVSPWTPVVEEKPMTLEAGLAFREEVEEELLQENISILRGSAAFKDIDPGQEECPPDWIARFGKDAAVVRFRLAKASWMPSKDAPVGLMMAAKVVQSIMKLRAERQIQPKLNVAIQFNVGTERPTFEVIDVDE